jgi:hypothetical protein
MGIALGYIVGCQWRPPPTTPTTLASLPGRDLEWQTHKGWRPVEFIRRRVTLQDHEAVSDLIRRVGLVPNVDMIEALSALNPGIDIIAPRPLPPGSSLDVPWPAEAASLPQPIELRVDERRKRKLSLELKVALHACHRIVGERVTEGRTTRPALPDQLHLRLSRICEVLSQMDGIHGFRSWITTRPFLDVTILETSIANDLLSRVSMRQILTSYNEWPLAEALLEELSKKVDQAASGDVYHIANGDVVRPVPRAAVEVWTKQVHRGSVRDVAGYRVWYRPMLDYSETVTGLPLGELSPSRAELAPGIYALWATLPNAAARLGLLKGVKVLPSRPVMRIDLVVEVRSE